ncbi:GAP family protein [Saccharomonospora sp.]|uniref:GAP family protein n=1 Tax=Saccharomonospora sp. TaxID=33913 RepID=UPI00260418A0|nr:GAP family protein [Saccharomonospora sp.]
MGTQDILAVAGLAVVDSTNFSLILGTIYLVVSNKRPMSRVLAFIGVFFTIYVVVGNLLAAGARSLELNETTVDYIQLGIGAALLLYGLVAPREKKTRYNTEGATSIIGAVGLGLTASAIEVATALPYFGAIAIVTQADLPVPVVALILIVYNFIAVSPCLLVAVLYSRSKNRFRAKIDAWMQRQREKKKTSRTGLLVLCVVAGLYISSDALFRLEYFGLVDIPEIPEEAK